MQEPNPELLRKAQRAQMLLLAVMVVFVLLPFLLLWLKRRGLFH